MVNYALRIIYKKLYIVPKQSHTPPRYDVYEFSSMYSFSDTHHWWRQRSNKEKPGSGPPEVSGSLDGGLQNYLESDDGSHDKLQEDLDYASDSK